jgi:UDP-glucose 4-epimerase
VLAVDNFERGYHQPLDFMKKQFKEALEIREIDLSTNNNFIRSNDQIDMVIHFAARCIVDESVTHPERYITYNPKLLENVLKAGIESGIKKYILSSTAAVYGEPAQVPVSEEAALKPINPYGESKVLSENILRQYSSRYNLDSIIFRYFNVCGASDDGLIGDSKKPSELLVQNAVRGALGIEPFYLTSTVVSTPDKSPIRDFIDVEDIARAHEMGAEYLHHNPGLEVCNLGTQAGVSVKQIVASVEKITQSKININTGKTRQGEQRIMIADSTKARKLLNWIPLRTIDDSVHSLLKWYQKHPKGWEY